MIRLNSLTLAALAASILGCNDSTGPRSTPVASIAITPDNTSMSGGATKQLAVTLRDANGNVIPAREVTWSSSNHERATVSSSGLVTARPVDGPVVITASIDGKSASATIDIHTFVRLSSGTGFSCGLTTDGAAYCWGDNEKGQIGDGTSTTRLVPTRVSTSAKFVAIASGIAHTCAITETGLAHCWGFNDWGQTGSSAPGNKTTSPVQVPGGVRFVSIAGAVNNTCATTSDREVYCWGYVQYFYDDGFGGRVTVSRQVEPLLSGSGMVAVVGGVDGRYCSVDSEGLAYCWNVQFFVPNRGPTLQPARGLVSSTLRFTTLRLGNQHTCGLVASGQAYCWGKNDLGQLGDGTTTSRNDPAPVAGELLFESLAAGGDWQTDDEKMASVPAGFTCGIAIGGTAYCWGSNRYGQLGIGVQPANVLTPQAIAGEIAFTGIRASSDHACGLAVGGAAYCWGSNGTGALGDATTVSANRPKLVFGE